MRIGMALMLVLAASSTADAQLIRPHGLRPGWGGSHTQTGLAPTAPVQKYAPLNRQSVGPSNAFMGYAPYLTPTTPTPLFTPELAGGPGVWSSGGGRAVRAPLPTTTTAPYRPLTPLPPTGRLR